MLDQLNPEAILVEHLEYLGKVAFKLCRNSGIQGADAEDFVTWLKIRLIENEYAVIRKFRGESGIKTYLTTVVTRQLFAYLREQRGRWRPSAAAERLGPPADELERLVHHDGYSLAQAGEKLRTEGLTTLSDTELARLLAQIPDRDPLRPREVSSDAVLESADAARADDRVAAAEAQARHDDLRRRVQRVLQQLSPEEQNIVRLYFQEGCSAADVARALNVDQKPLYRRIPRLKQRLLELLEREGISGGSFLDREDP
ncbi:sigma-70 family RNA polymerase sigma factor [Longimicrobium sp.]|uniref:sigma-70 family RNA polymerase sigma factor n=1 Tax=Longimicrobium sp. TaxID=2029185 RepID=UPI002E2ED2CE|nr:sigma-70 family RNA polymerase sigma factor [Longimicrobium sp.]HEX6042473.1 sigma-70 family RNA polymerase sigma factor [Longimicrobium sp.]